RQKTVSVSPDRTQIEYNTAGEAALRRSTARLRLAVQRPQLDLGLLQPRSPGLRQPAPRPIDVEVQHRHRRGERPRFPPPAALCGALERQSDLPRIGLGEDSILEVQGVAGSGHPLRPPSAAGRGSPRHQMTFRRTRSGPPNLWIRTSFIEA